MGAQAVFWPSRAEQLEGAAFALQNYRKSCRHLAAFINKFVQFIHKYITYNAAAAVSFLQKHADPLQ